MASIRITDSVNPSHELEQVTTGDDGNSSAVRSVYKTRPVAPSHKGEKDDSICNIRSQPGIPERINSRATHSEADEDPRLRKPGDFREKQVCLCRRNFRTCLVLCFDRPSKAGFFYGLPTNLSVSSMATSALAPSMSSPPHSAQHHRSRTSSEFSHSSSGVFSWW